MDPVQSTFSVPSISSFEGYDEKYFEYKCNFLDASTNLWKNDSRVCNSTIVASDAMSQGQAMTQVACKCLPSVDTQVVSLDYVQAANTDEKQVGSCHDPCGCSKKKRLEPYAIALIVLAVLSIFVILTIGAAITSVILLNRYLGKGMLGGSSSKYVLKTTENNAEHEMYTYE